MSDRIPEGKGGDAGHMENLCGTTHERRAAGIGPHERENWKSLEKEGKETSQ